MKKTGYWPGTIDIIGTREGESSLSARNYYAE